MRVEALEWSLGFSKTLLLIIIFGHVGAFIVLISPLMGHLSDMPLLAFRLVITFFLGLNIRYIVRTHLLRSAPRAVVKLWQDTNGRLGCQFKMGQSALGTLKQNSFLSTVFLILRLKISNRVVNIIIFKDSIPFEAYRILCARLKHCA